MAKLPLLLRRTAADTVLSTPQQRCFCNMTCEKNTRWREHSGRWLKLPPFSANIVDPSTVGEHMMKGTPSSYSRQPNTTILKWVRLCCPTVPLDLVHKLFRLRQVRKQAVGSIDNYMEGQTQIFKRVSPKDIIGQGDVIVLPNSVQEFLPVDSKDNSLKENEVNYIRSLELYKDSAIIVVNKPHGLPVQGGNGIKISMDVLAAASLRYDYIEPPRLIHRLDRDTSGVLMLGRTATSTSILHSIFREKTFEASAGIGMSQRILQRKYWALVIGTPKRPRGVITAPLTKIIIDNGKSERLSISKSLKSTSSQNAITEYQVIGSSRQGFTWLELRPLTGRKHQLRVHCAEVLGTPIVGDLKYGWLSHRKWEPLLSPMSLETKEFSKGHDNPFGLCLQGGGVCDKNPHLHLHCRQTILPDIQSVAKSLKSLESSCDLSHLGSLDLVAPLPYHMQRSWDAMDKLT